MEQEKDVIIFGGDSFTWGEGLELYLDTPYWINERNIENGWLQLQRKQTIESIEFREKHRFPGIVSDYFNVNPIVHRFNGGQFETPINVIEEKLPKINPTNLKAIIIQFTSLNRMLLHLDLKCKCKFCISTGYQKPSIIYTDFLEKTIKNIPLTPIEKFGLDYLRDNYGIQYEHITSESIRNIDVFKDIDDLFLNMYNTNLKLFIEKYINNWKQIAPVYFIDSWDFYSSNLLSEFIDIKSKIIPLKGYDGKYYTKWYNWENTFPYKRIVNEFPNSQNGHPTLIQHQYIAESIIEFLK